jgi:hypothetical protein
MRLPEDDADALKYVGMLTIYKIFLIYIYIYVYVYSAFVVPGPDINCTRCTILHML